MPTIPQNVLTRPKSWDEFEDIVWDLYTRLWDDPHAQRYGRSGQAQQGVDVYGRPARLDDGYAGIQGKRYGAGNLTRPRIEAEIAKAEAFTPPLAEYLIATTEPRAAGLQAPVREIDAARRAAGNFPTGIVFWDDLSGHLKDPANHDLLDKHYGDWLRSWPTSPRCRLASPARCCG
jgi:hypothetical protein